MSQEASPARAPTPLGTPCGAWACMALTNIKPAPQPIAPRRITDAHQIRAALALAGVEIGPDPGHDGDWAARVEYQPSGRSSAAIVDLVAFGNQVKAVKRNCMEAGRLVWIEGDRLVLEGEGDHAFMAP